MLIKVEARNAAGNVLSLPLQDISGGYTLKDITGLDPVKATIVSSSYADRDGTQYQSSRRDARNIVLKIGFSADWIVSTPKQLRDNLYKWFMTKSQVSLRFYEDNGLIVEAVGRVESNVSPRFTADPDSTISVLCPLPDFIGMSNELISGSSVSTAVESNLNYIGTIETPFIFTLNINRAVSGFTIYQRGPDGVQNSLDFIANLIAGDVINVSTVPGNKYATLTRAGATGSILYGVSPYSSWLTFAPGTNYLRLLISGNPVPYTIAYTNKYGGL